MVYRRMTVAASLAYAHCSQCNIIDLSARLPGKTVGIFTLGRSVSLSHLILNMITTSHNAFAQPLQVRIILIRRLTSFQFTIFHRQTCSVQYFIKFFKIILVDLNQTSSNREYTRVRTWLLPDFPSLKSSIFLTWLNDPYITSTAFLLSLQI